MAISGAGYEAWDKTTGTTVMKPWPGELQNNIKQHLKIILMLWNFLRRLG